MASLGGLQAWLRPHASRLLQEATRLGISVRVTSVRRSKVTQARLYRDYLKGLSRFPAAPPGHSLHEIGRAFDLVPIPYNTAALARLGAIWQSWGGTWGQKFNDPIHFEA